MIMLNALGLFYPPTILFRFLIFIMLLDDNKYLILIYNLFIIIKFNYIKNDNIRITRILNASIIYLRFIKRRQLRYFSSCT